MSFRIIGHRGDKARYRDNTISSFQSILKSEGIDGFELDIVVTKDKELVVAHDYFIKDLSNRKHYIYNLTYNRLRTLSNLFDSDTNFKNMKYPKLEDIFIMYKKQSKKKTILLEIKSLPNNDELPFNINELIAKIHELIDKYNMSDLCYIISFDYRIIQESYKQNPLFKIGQILHANLLPLRELIEILNLDILLMHKDWITKEQVLEAYKLDMDIYAWVPNTEKEFSYLDSIGVKGMITDRVQDLLFYKKYRDKGLENDKK